MGVSTVWQGGADRPPSLSSLAKERADKEGGRVVVGGGGEGIRPYPRAKPSLSLYITLTCIHCKQTDRQIMQLTHNTQFWGVDAKKKENPKQLHV